MYNLITHHSKESAHLKTGKASQVHWSSFEERVAAISEWLRRCARVRTVPLDMHTVTLRSATLETDP